jgi:hypothetical protein
MALFFCSGYDFILLPNDGQSGKLASFWYSPKARVTSGGGFRLESCRLNW